MQFRSQICAWTCKVLGLISNPQGGRMKQPMQAAYIHMHIYMHIYMVKKHRETSSAITCQRIQIKTMLPARQHSKWSQLLRGRGVEDSWVQGQSRKLTRTLFQKLKRGPVCKGSCCQGWSIPQGLIPGTRRIERENWSCEQTSTGTYCGCAPVPLPHRFHKLTHKIKLFL